MVMSEERAWVSIGQVTAPHGLQGEVRVYPLTDVEGRFHDVERVYLLPEGVATRRVVHVERAVYRRNLVIVKLREVNDIDEAETLRGALVQVPVEEVAPLPEGTYYVFQLVGLRVETVDGAPVGRIIDVITNSAANDVYVVERPDAQPALIPAVRHIVREIDIEKGRMTIDPMPGLL